MGPYESLLGVMMRAKAQPLIATALLSIAFLPALTALLVSGHVFMEHEASRQEACDESLWHSEATLAVLAHGHSHREGTPEHRHDATWQTGRTVPQHPVIARLSADSSPRLYAASHSGERSSSHPLYSRGSPRCLSFLCVLLL